MQDCRFGRLKQDTYCFLHGTPTYVPALEGCSQCGHDILEDPVLGRYKKSWADVFLKGADMSTHTHIEGSECATCSQTRTLRQRVLSLEAVPNSVSDQARILAEVRQPPFTDAPALYTFNVPRYFNIQLRAREFARKKEQPASLVPCRGYTAASS